MGKITEIKVEDAYFYLGTFTLPVWEMMFMTKDRDGSYGLRFERDGFIYVHDNIRPEIGFGSAFVTIRLSRETIVSKQRIL